MRIGPLIFSRWTFLLKINFLINDRNSTIIITGFPGESFPTRKDVLTKKPLDFEEEDEARKFETSKWLESHFGSESRSSHGSIDADDSPLPTSANTSYINITMKSCAPKERDYQNVNSNRHQRRSTGRDSASPSGYFHGISEWSERYQGKGITGLKYTSSGYHLQFCDILYNL